MARQTGSTSFAGTLEVLAGGPIDARSIVQTKADLTIASNFPYPYVGMQTYVVAEGKSYTLTSLDVTSLLNWREEGGSGSGSYLRITDLGTEYTTELKNDISSGKFEKAVVGGKLTINGHVYYMAHPDYWLHTGDTECTTHHMVVVPAENLLSAEMNESNITTDGYTNSFMRKGKDEEVEGQTVHTKGGIELARDIIRADFGAENILTHRELLVNVVTDGKVSGWAWIDSDIDLMNEIMIYGHNAWVTLNYNGYETGIDKTQLELFAKRPDLITTRSSGWLRDVASSTLFATVHSSGFAHNGRASLSLGVRPAFAIC